MLGAPASGKGTQGRLLAEELGIEYLSTGARLRREIEKGSPLGLRAKSYLDANQYVPDELAIELVQEWVLRHEDGWMLDGFPRSVPQAEALLGLAANLNHSPVPFKVIHLEVPVLELRKRVTTRRECPHCGTTTTSEHHTCPQCGSSDLEARTDDSTEGFEKRLAAYQDLTIPALELLKKRTEVVTIDGAGTREEVAQLIKTQLT